MHAGITKTLFMIWYVWEWLVFLVLQMWADSPDPVLSSEGLCRCLSSSRWTGCGIPTTLHSRRTGVPSAMPVFCSFSTKCGACFSSFSACAQIFVVLLIFREKIQKGWLFFLQLAGLLSHNTDFITLFVI